VQTNISNSLQATVASYFKLPSHRSTYYYVAIVISLDQNITEIVMKKGNFNFINLEPIKKFKECSEYQMLLKDPLTKSWKR